MVRWPIGWRTQTERNGGIAREIHEATEYDMFYVLRRSNRCGHRSSTRRRRVQPLNPGIICGISRTDNGRRRKDLSKWPILFLITIYEDMFKTANHCNFSIFFSFCISRENVRIASSIIAKLNNGCVIFYFFLWLFRCIPFASRNARQILVVVRRPPSWREYRRCRVFASSRL